MFVLDALPNLTCVYHLGHIPVVEHKHETTLKMAEFWVSRLTMEAARTSEMSELNGGTIHKTAVFNIRHHENPKSHIVLPSF